MSVRLQVTLQDLSAKGITANDLTAEEIVQLVHACERVDNPYSDINAELVEKPIKVRKGLYLWRPTAGAVVWLTEYVERWWKRDSAFYRWAQIYALVNARDMSAFMNLRTRPAIRAAVLFCALRLCVHTGELMRAVNLAYGVREWDAEDDRKQRETQKSVRTDFAALVARLEVKSGIPRETWLWERNIFSMMKSYSEMMELATAAFGGVKHATRDELDDAVQNLAATIANITRRIKRAQNEGSEK